MKLPKSASFRFTQITDQCHATRLTRSGSHDPSAPMLTSAAFGGL